MQLVAHLYCCYDVPCCCNVHGLFMTRVQQDVLVWLHIGISPCCSLSANVGTSVLLLGHYNVPCCCNVDDLYSWHACSKSRYSNRRFCWSPHWVECVAKVHGLPLRKRVSINGDSVNQSINKYVFNVLGGNWDPTDKKFSSVNSYRQDLLPTCKACPKETTICI